MKRLRYVRRLLFVCLLSACTFFSDSLLPNPQTVPTQLTVMWFRLTHETDGQQSLLAVQRTEQQQWRWVQTDAFGAPLARQLSDQYGWKNDGFLPPNRTAGRLFAAVALIAAAQTNTEISAIYPSLEVVGDAQSARYLLKGKLLWSVWHLNSDQWRIGFDNDSWLVQRLPE